MMKWPIVLLSFLMAVGLAGCLPDAGDSCDVETKDVSLVATVVDTADSIRAEIDFERGDRSGIDQPLTLCEDDVLSINGEDPVETERPGRVAYGLTFPSDADRTVSFQLDRLALDDRIAVEVELPSAFEIVAPEPDAVVSRATDLLVQWAPPEPEQSMRIELGEEIGMGVCIYTEVGDHHYKKLGGIEVPDDGDWTIPAGSIASDTPQQCAAYYTLQRIAPGAYPEDIRRGGYVEARVERTVGFQSAP